MQQLAEREKPPAPAFLPSTGPLSLFAVRLSLVECETMTIKRTQNLSIHSRENHRPNIISWLAAQLLTAPVILSSEVPVH